MTQIQVPLSFYVSIRELSPLARPSLLHRASRTRLLVIDPRSSKLKIHEWWTAHATDTEREALHSAWGLPPMGQEPMPDWMIEGACLLYVPPHLRVPGEPAIQGGATMERRWRDGDLVMEIAMLDAELRRGRATA